VTAIPGAANTASANVTGTASTVNGVTIYIGAFTKNHNSCAAEVPAT